MGKKDEIQEREDWDYRWKSAALCQIKERDREKTNNKKMKIEGNSNNRKSSMKVDWKRSSVMLKI